MQFSQASLQPYLQHKLGQPCEVTEVEKFGRGSSRETWFITYRTDGTARHLVFRRDPEAGATDFSSLRQEFTLYERLGRTQVPVAAALW